MMNPKKASEVSKLFGWDCHTVVVPTFNLVNDFQRLVKEVRCKKKTHFECCFPFLYVYPEIKEQVVLSGWDPMMVTMVYLKKIYVTLWSR